MEDNCLIARDNFCFACFFKNQRRIQKAKNAIFLSSKDDGTRVTSRRHCSKKETKKNRNNVFLKMKSTTVADYLFNGC